MRFRIYAFLTFFNVAGACVSGYEMNEHQNVNMLFSDCCWIFRVHQTQFLCDVSFFWSVELFLFSFTVDYVRLYSWRAYTRSQRKILMSGRSSERLFLVLPRVFCFGDSGSVWASFCYKHQTNGFIRKLSASHKNIVHMHTHIHRNKWMSAVQKPFSWVSAGSCILRNNKSKEQMHAKIEADLHKSSERVKQKKRETEQQQRQQRATNMQPKKSKQQPNKWLV